MAGVPAYDRPSTLDDIRALKRRGLSTAQIAAQLGIARSTLYRILQEANTRRP